MHIHTVLFNKLVVRDIVQKREQRTTSHISHGEVYFTLLGKESDERIYPKTFLIEDNEPPWIMNSALEFSKTKHLQ